MFSEACCGLGPTTTQVLRRLLWWSCRSTRCLSPIVIIHLLSTYGWTAADKHHLQSLGSGADRPRRLRVPYLAYLLAVLTTYLLIILHEAPPACLGVKGYLRVRRGIHRFDSCHSAGGMRMRSHAASERGGRG